MSSPNSNIVPIAADIGSFLDGMPGYLEKELSQAAVVAVGVKDMKAKVTQVGAVSDGATMWTRIYGITVEEPADRFVDGYITMKVGKKVVGHDITVEYRTVARNLGAMVMTYVEFRNEIDAIMRESVYAQLLSAMAIPKKKEVAAKVHECPSCKC
jgi:hypothetical protein